MAAVHGIRHTITFRRKYRGESRPVVYPVVPLVQMDEFVFEFPCTELLEYFVDGPCKTFWFGTWAMLLPVEQYAGVVQILVKRDEVLRVVRYPDDGRLATPLYQLCVRGVFAESVLCLFDVVAPLAKDSLEDAAHVLVEENRCAWHYTFSFGFSDSSRTWSNADSFSRWRARISSTLS